jgi:uncharacterized delta-60 repeat protein
MTTALSLCVSLLFGLLLSAVTTKAGDLVSPVWSYVRDGGQGSDWIRGVALDRQGVLAAVGALRTTANYGDGACVMRFGSPGWTNVLDLGPVQAGVRDEVNDRFQGVATDSQDNVVVVGNKSGAYNSDGYHVAAILRKYAPSGTLLWERIQSNGAWSSAYGVSLDASDSIYVAGSVFANWTIEEGQWAIWKYNKDGTLQTGFPVYYNFSSGSGSYQYQDIAFDIAADGAGGFVVVGRRGVAVGNVDWHVRKYDASRALVWQDTYAGPANGVDDAYRVAADREGNFVVAGYTIKAPNDYDWLVIKYRGSDGQRLWTRTYESAAGRSEACYTVAVDGLDNVLVGGGEVGTDGKTHWRLEHLAKADGQLLAAQVWPSDQDEILYAVAYRDRQIALGGSQSNGTNTDLRMVTGLFGASLRVEPRALDLGTVTTGSRVERMVTVTNISAQSVTLGTIAAHDPLAAPFVIVADDCSGRTFAPGAGGTVTVAFQPSVAGRFTDTFDIAQAPPSPESYSVSVSGRGVEPATLASEVFAYIRDGGYGNDAVRGVALDSQGVLVAAGSLRSTTTPDYLDAACLMRFGTPVWTNVVDLGPVQPGYRDEANDRFCDVATDSQDNVVVVGNKSGAYGGAEGYHVAAMLRKYSPTGTLLWEKIQSLGAWSSAYGVSLDASDNIYVAGAVFANWTIEEGQWAIWKYDKDGTLQTGFPIYYNFASGSGAYQYQDIAFDLAVDGAGGFLVVGRRGVAVGNVDWHVRKYDASRALVWQDTYAGPANGVDDAYKVAADSEGNFVVAGYTIKAPSDYDWLVIKYRGSDGQRLWTRTYESAPGRSEACYTVAVDGLDNALVGGGEVGTDGKTHWRLEHLAKADGQLLAAQVWPSDQDEVLYAVAYRDRQIALGGSQSNGNNTDFRVIVAVPPPSKITGCTWTAPNLLSLQWRGAMEPVTLLHTPTLSSPDWQPLAGPLREPSWTGPSTLGFLRLRER